VFKAGLQMIRVRCCTSCRTSFPHSTGDPDAKLFEDFGAEAIEILQYPWWWDHTTLTVYVKTSANVSEGALAEITAAFDIWNAAIAHRHGAGFVELLNVTATATAREAAQADIIINLNGSGGRLAGQTGMRRPLRGGVPSASLGGVAFRRSNADDADYPRTRACFGHRAHGADRWD
jgi:hypothetical protein